MRIVCTICTDSITDDFAATPCGHTFHYTCLSQWLGHQKTCPQCRERCMVRNVIKLFVDSSDLSRIDVEDISPQEMKDKLALQENLLKHKDKALEEARASLEEVRADMQAWQTQYDSTHRKLKTEQAACSSLKKQLTVMQHECDRARTVEKQAEKMKMELSTMKGVDAVLRGTKEEVEGLLKNYTSTSQLATFVIAMKRDYEALKQKKVTLQKEKDKLVQDVSYTKKQLRSKETELKDSQEKLAVAESDTEHFEQENSNLRKKVEMLEKAVESPGSRFALKRILESPMPFRGDHGVATELGASPLLTTHTKSKTENEVVKSLIESIENVAKPDIGSKRSHSDQQKGVLLPVNKQFKVGNPSEHVAAGFNGMGGQSQFLMPMIVQQQKSKKLPKHLTHAPAKGLKFAPRFRSTHKTSSSRQVQPKLFFGQK